MKLLFIIILLSLNLFSASSYVKSKEQILLESIQKHAIQIGTGNSQKVYIFVDPMCNFSQKLVTKIIGDEHLQEENTYYIFLYRLEMFESDSLIWYIFESDDKMSNLEEVMIYGGTGIDGFKPNNKTLKALKEISEVGENLNIILRPYTISFKKDSKYCKVSSGEASCEDDSW